MTSLHNSVISQPMTDRRFSRQTCVILNGFLGLSMSRDSVIGIATRCGLDSLGIETWWDKMLRILQNWPWRPSNLLYSDYWVFPGVKRLGRGTDYPPSSSAEVKERIKLYIYSPSGPSWPILGEL